MAVELTVVLKDDERTVRQKFLIYDIFRLGDPADELVAKCIKEASVNFQGEPDDILVRTTMVWK